MIVSTEVCGNPLCGSMVALDMQIEVPDQPGQFYRYPVFHCSRCEGHTEVVTQLFRGFDNFRGGQFYMAYAVDETPYAAWEEDVWRALSARRSG